MSDDLGTTVPAGGGRHRRRDEAAAAPQAAPTPVDAPSAVAPSQPGPAQPGPAAQRGPSARPGPVPQNPAAGPLATGPGTAAAARTLTTKRKPLTFWQELPILVALAVALAVVIKMFAFQAFVIPSESMESTIKVHDRVMTNKLIYDIRDPHRGEVIVFERNGRWPELSDTSVPASAVGRFVQNAGKFVGFVPSGTDFIKRVVGLPGDTIKCCDAGGHMLVNGKPLDESYTQGSNVSSSRTLNFTELKVPEGQLFVMGDNREHSSDSRAYGTVPIDKVVGRAVFVMWPRSHWKGLPVPAPVEQFAAAPSAVGSVPALAAVAALLPVATLRARRRRRWRRDRA